jgi:hypothetical protein
MKRVKIRRNDKQVKFLKFVANMNEWEFKVFDAFRARLKVDELSTDSLSKQAYDLFVSSPDNKVAQLLVSAELRGWRPVGITLFAELIRLDISRNDDAIIQAIQKASTIGAKEFKVQYPTASKFSPKDILVTVLKDDYNITLEAKIPDQKSQYDALRETEEVKEVA